MHILNAIRATHRRCVEAGHVSAVNDRANHVLQQTKKAPVSFFVDFLELPGYRIVSLEFGWMETGKVVLRTL